MKIGAKIVRHGRSITFQMAELMVSRDLFQKILDAIAARRETCVPMLDTDPESRSISRQGSSRFPGILPLRNVRSEG